MKSKNYYLYSDNPAQIERWESEYRYIGRHTKRIPKGLIVFALPPQPVKKKTEKRGKPNEDRQNTVNKEKWRSNA